MNAGRAKQILNSPEEITVHYQGKAIWIEKVDETGNTVRVSPKNEPDNEMTVNVSQLEEL